MKKLFLFFNFSKNNLWYYFKKVVNVKFIVKGVFFFIDLSRKFGKLKG